MNTANFRQKIKRILIIVFISLIIAVPIRYFVVQPFLVDGISMEPSFSNKDFLIIDKISYFFKKPARRDVVVFLPNSKKELFVKRIAGLPEETLQIKDGSIFIYDKKQDQWIRLSEKYLPQGAKTYPDLKITLGKNEYFVFGDNREKSIDSRDFGPISLKQIIGKVFLRLWPINLEIRN